MPISPKLSLKISKPQCPALGTFIKRKQGSGTRKGFYFNMMKMKMKLPIIASDVHFVLRRIDMIWILPSDGSMPCYSNLPNLYLSISEETPSTIFCVLREISLLMWQVAGSHALGRWSEGVPGTTPQLARLGGVSGCMEEPSRMSLLTSLLPHPTVWTLDHLSDMS